MTNNIKKIRNKLGLSRQQMATAISCSATAIANYEHNYRDPRIKVAYRIIDLAKIHGINLRLEDIYPRDK